jgi:26S proteasome regulatory subunit N6
LFAVIPKAKTAKIVRSILGIVSLVPDSLSIQIELCNDVIAWCVLEKRTFLRQRIEAKLSSLLLQSKQPVQALELIDKLLGELKKLDDKQMLTETHLTESRIYHCLKNVPKGRVDDSGCEFGSWVGGPLSLSLSLSLYIYVPVSVSLTSLSFCLIHC